MMHTPARTLHWIVGVCLVLGDVACGGSTTGMETDANPESSVDVPRADAAADSAPDVSDAVANVDGSDASRTDAGSDTMPDSARDSAPDAAPDAPTDAPIDSPPDAPTDAPIDVPLDTQQDVPGDTALDAPTPDVTMVDVSGATDAAPEIAAPDARDAGTGRPTVTLPRPGAGAMWGGARAGMVLMSDGTVWDWGADFNGRLGIGSTVQTDSYVPVEVLGPGGVGHLSNVTDLAGGELFTIALRSDGSVWSWGDDMFGELGVGVPGSPMQSSLPVQVHGPGNVGNLSSIVAVGSRGYHALALASDGTLWAWGFNSAGELGDGTTTNSGVPVHVRGPGGVGLLTNIEAATGGYVHSLALATGGTVWAWGGNANGQIGNGSTTYAPFPVPVASATLAGVTQVTAGWKHSLALRGDGTVWAWGQNDHGEVGNGCSIGVNCADVTSPVQVAITNVVAVSGGDCHSAALRADGTVWTWGCNYHNGRNPAMDPVGQLGNGDTTYTDQSRPVQVHGPNNVGFLTNVVAIAARDYHNYALLADGTLWSWGSNLNGQLGNGTCCAPSTFPVQVQLP